MRKRNYLTIDDRSMCYYHAGEWSSSILTTAKTRPIQANIEVTPAHVDKGVLTIIYSLVLKPKGTD